MALKNKIHFFSRLCEKKTDYFFGFDFAFYGTNYPQKMGLGPKLSQKEVGRELPNDKKTVRHWLNVYNTTNDVVEEERAGRRRSTTASDDNHLLEFAEEHAEANSKDIARNLKRKHLEVDPRTVRRRLTEAGVFSLPPRFAPLLDTQLRTARLEWALKNQKRNWK